MAVFSLLLEAVAEYDPGAYLVIEASPPSSTGAGSSRPGAFRILQVVQDPEAFLPIELGPAYEAKFGAVGAGGLLWVRLSYMSAPGFRSARIVVKVPVG